MEFLTKDMIKKIDHEFEMKKVEIPEWNGYVYVREIRARERDLYEAMTFAISDGDPAKAMDNYRARFVVISACDENGELLFQPEDAEWLGQKQVAPVNRIFKVAREINGLTVEEAEKNFEGITDVDSVSS